MATDPNRVRVRVRVTVAVGVEELEGAHELGARVGVLTHGAHQVDELALAEPAALAADEGRGVVDGTPERAAAHRSDRVQRLDRREAVGHLV